MEFHFPKIGVRMRKQCTKHQFKEIISLTAHHGIPVKKLLPVGGVNIKI